MKTYQSILVSIAAAMTFLHSSTALATPVMDVHLEDLMTQSSDVKQSLNLNANQQRLWQQVESTMRAIMSERQRRREQLQADLKKGLDNPHAELRDLAKQLGDEEDFSYQENKRLRELWLTVNDALDDTQRRTILLLLTDRLQRMPDEAHECKPADQPRARGPGKQRPNNMNNPPSQ